MFRCKYVPGLSGASLSVFLLNFAFFVTAHAQCVDSSAVNDYRVRSIRFNSLFGRLPKELRQMLDAHRGERYSAERAKEYIDEIVAFRANDPVQQKYERLIVNKLKLSVKGGLTELECVAKADPAECQRDFPGSTQCVDVTLRRYFVELDALDSSPYLLLFPRSALAAFYGALPRPLLALNPGLDAGQDRRVGPTLGADTATDLLDLRDLFGKTSSRGTDNQPPARSTTSPTSASDLNVTTVAGGSGAATDGNAAASDLSGSNTSLLLRLKGMKALAKDFYDGGAGLTLVHIDPLNTLQRLRLAASFEAQHLPRGKDEFLRNAASLDFGADLRFKTPPLKLIDLQAGYRWSRNRFSGTSTTAPAVNTENGFAARAIFDGSIRKGLTRSALWFDGGKIDRGSYRRLAGMFGYGKEFVIERKLDFHKISPPELGTECWTVYSDEPKKNESTVGVEVLAGAGHLWGTVPEYARFFGGSPAGQFLHDELAAPAVSAFPTGPMLRSFGQSQAVTVIGPGNTRGGSSYWHANLNVAVPISAWSRPLIPHEWVTTSALKPEDERFKGHVPEGALICRDLKSTVKTLVSISGVNLMVNQQARDQLTDAQKRDLRLRNKENRTAEEETRLAAAEADLTAAKAAVKPGIEDLFNSEILPITDFIADHANVFAVKPLFMFDAGYLRLPGSSTTRYAAGGGLQLDVILARFEFGYLARLSRTRADPRGNLVARLVLKRFF